MNSGAVLNDSLVQIQDALDLLWSLCKVNQWGLACWNAPTQEHWTILIDRNPKQWKYDEVKLTELPRGYIATSFPNSNNLSTPFFIEAKSVLTYSLEGRLLHSQLESEVESFLYFGKKTKESTTRFRLKEEENPSSFLSNIETAKKNMLDGSLQKIVFARRRILSFQHIQIGERFLSLRKKHPHAFLSFLYHPLTNSWITATPETLLSMDAFGKFRTMALAGTQSFPAGDISQVRWSHKEIEEQALVSRYIINCFKKIRLREYEEIGPRTIRAGNVVHLKTDYTVDTKEIHFPELPDTMMRLLHPTSAVCGMPKDIALEMVNSIEGFERGLYCGFIGPTQEAGTTTLYVNIRCAQLLDQEAILYAGAGITEESNAEKEWQETELKLETIQSFFYDN
ncbi:MAG: chorismate-binding protein [Cytophagaceae bacterium]|jgi:isochorismate synthase|nr:chorismate-binding protein [Cytophagaceae bacterium]